MKIIISIARRRDRNQKKNVSNILVWCFVCLIIHRNNLMFKRTYFPIPYLAISDGDHLSILCISNISSKSLAEGFPFCQGMCCTCEIFSPIFLRGVSLRFPSEDVSCTHGWTPQINLQVPQRCGCSWEPDSLHKLTAFSACGEGREGGCVHTWLCLSGCRFFPEWQ